MTPTMVRVAVAAPIREVLHYGVPPALAGVLRPGQQVYCPLGRRSVTGVVVELADSVEPGHGPAKLRPLSGIVDLEPMVSPDLVAVLAKAAAYYRTAPGELVRAALPPGAAVAAARIARLTAQGEETLVQRSSRDLLGNRETDDPDASLLARLDQGRAPLSELSAAERTRLWRLVASGMVAVEDLPPEPRVRPRQQRFAIVGEVPEGAAALLERAPAQAHVLSALMEREEMPSAEVARMSAGAASALRGLVKRGWVRIEAREVMRDPHASDWLRDGARESVIALTDAQQEALDAVTPSITTGEHQSVLLHGVTGSGKTEVYLRAIANARERGRSALVLVPEISLTPQLVAVFRRRFGDGIAALHSGMSSGQRFDEWRRIRAGVAPIVVGARSACFAPLPEKVGVVVIDEEHDASFKQEEGVRYDGREIALARARRDGAVALLGSATPRLETYHAARSGGVTLVELPHRATPRPLPEVQVVDMRRDVERPPRGCWLGPRLRAALGRALADGGQAILFLNRRGFASVALCRECGAGIGCARCDVTLTFHRESERLICHYCGEAKRLPDRCASCQTGRPELLGVGTERIAAEVSGAITDARVVRLDRDSASRRGLQQIIRQFRRGEANVLIGTQMVTKGHDFPRVTFVGVVAADMSLRIPDFRGAERTFQLLTQVAGRAGRGEAPGLVLVQAYLPEHPAVTAARDHDYQAFADVELESRRSRGYPPFGRLAMIRFAGKEPAAVRSEAQRIARLAEDGGRGSGVTVLGPAPAPISRIRNRFRWQLLLRADTRRELAPAIDAAAAARAVRGVQVDIDVDPESML